MKASRNKQRSAKPKSKSRKSATAQKPGKGALHRDAAEIVKGAQDLYEKAHLLDREADDLHGGIHEAHERALELSHDATRPQVSAPASGPLVLGDGPERPAKPFTIVGIGASAGGYEACAEFLSELPADTGMAFILVQHLDPNHRSHLSELLSQRSRIPVVPAEHEMEVAPGRLYVLPENLTLTLQGGKLQLHSRRRTESPPMPIDLFFRSLAEHQQNRAIGVILSGTGCDGTLGMEAIKGQGGITFAQSDSSSKFYGMPGSAAGAGAVDFLMSPTEIAHELAEIARHPLVGSVQSGPVATNVERAKAEGGAGESLNEIGTVFRLLRARTGVDFSLYKQSTLKRRIIRRMILHKKELLLQYVRLLEANPGELDALFNDLLINVTTFFRDPKTYEVLKKKLFPKILKAKEADAPLRFWVCGCSTGEEAYSLAIAIVELFDQTRTHGPVQIFATDISPTGIEKARAGLYPPAIQQDVSPERLRRFFTKVNGQYQVQKSIRDMCVFARQNVLVDPPFSNLDLVSCRNVLIYFGPTLQRRIIPLFHYALRNSGYLLLGSSETIGQATEHFAIVDKKHKIYQKKPSYARPALNVPARNPELEIRPGRASALGGDERKPLDMQQQIDRLLLREFSPATVVVNSQLDVVHFRGRTGLFLEHAPGSASLNLFKMLRESLVVTVRAALSKSVRQSVAVRHSGIEFRHNGTKYDVEVEVVPLKLEPSEEKFYAIIFRERRSSGAELPFHGKETASATSARLKRELSKTRSDLLSTRESLQSIIEEQEATNEELKSANEEIQSSNEELQSTNEELETAKEELQSTNEELTTLNEELQNRNVELSQANNDLLNLLASVNIAILMVAQDLTIRRFTPTAERLFNLIPSDVGRRLTDMNRSILAPDMEQTIRQVIDDLTIVERETQDRGGHWYLLRIRPYRTSDNRIEGAVIVLIDIDELRQALEVVMGMVRQPALILGVDLKVRSANNAFLHMFGLEPDKVMGKMVYEVDDKQWDLPQLHSLLEEVLPRQKHVVGYLIEAHFPKIGFRKLRVSASRFFEEGKGMRLVFLALEDAA